MAAPIPFALCAARDTRWDRPFRIGDADPTGQGALPPLGPLAQFTPGIFRERENSGVARQRGSESPSSAWVAIQSRKAISAGLAARAFGQTR
ncbi:hypothetical protein SAMN05421850_101511 [Lutimaribacter saemankumensis]|uniref:Uncharacterized protein n=1 Tax=Lutimaribacter saemankumensis TaxID=490829 RepID=A0A1G8HHH6_9RHOB|nr:hypothetical protein SAMN05421850_101511 [Lutimaribacter saemankumensis]